MRAVRWWQKAVVYEIYPRSFQDSNGDGIGDLAGVTARLDYFSWLGVDAIWLAPIFPSPMADFGYDVADYTDIDPIFGTLADFDALLEQAHRRDLKVILDYVPNHTSDRHPWFVEARSSRTNRRRDWYIWRDPRPDGGPPTNWLSEFGGPAWTFDDLTGQYYYHAFLKEQPDLNWRNPEVRAAMHDVLRFWLDRGVDGFRIDTVHHLIKDDRFRDNPPNPDFQPGMPPQKVVNRVYTVDRPEVHDVLAGMRRVVDAYADRVLIGEAYLPIDRLVAYYGAELGGVHLPFNFHLIGAPWSAATLADLIGAYEAALPPGAWPNWVLGNHDRSRVASRLGPESVRLAAMLLLTLRGTPTMYYGDELGMVDVPIPPDIVQDPWEKNVPGLGLGRDPVRTPMPWSSQANGGFTSGRPWLPLGPDGAVAKVDAQRSDPNSLLTLYRALLALRRREPALQLGDHASGPTSPDILHFIRSYGTARIGVWLNFSNKTHLIDIAADKNGAEILLSTEFDRSGSVDQKSLTLRPAEGIIVRLS